MLGFEVGVAGSGFSQFGVSLFVMLGSGFRFGVFEVRRVEVPCFEVRG